MKKTLLVFSLLMLSSCASGPCRGVIGAGYDTHTGVVDYIYPGSPARLMGIESGDVLINRSNWEGNVGDEVMVEFVHVEGELTIQVTKPAVLVCVDKYREEW